MSLDHQTIAEELARKLDANGFHVVRTVKDKRLTFILNDSLGEQPRGGIMIALEGGGCHWWDGADGPHENPFRLISSGFDMENAATLAGILNCLRDLLRIDPIIEG